VVDVRHDAEVADEGLIQGPARVRGSRPLTDEGPWTGTALLDSAAVANIKSQIKRNRQNEGRRVRNKGVRTALKTEAKKVRSAATSGDTDGLQDEFRRAAMGLDKAVAKGALHKLAAARRKSRLARAANANAIAKGT